MILDLFDRKKTDDSGAVSSDTRIIRHRIGVGLNLIGTITVVIIVGLIFVTQAHNRNFTTWQMVSDVEYTWSEGSESTRLGDKFLIYNPNGASCVSREGVTVWNQTFEMQSLMLDVCKEAAAFGDFNGHIIFTANADGITGQIDTKMPLRDFCIAANGTVAAVLDETSITWIYLYDKTGATVAYFKTTMNQSGYPVDIAISDDGHIVMVSFLYVDSGSVKTSVAFYNFGDVGQNKIDNFVSSYDYSGVVTPCVHFFDNDTSVAVSDAGLAFFEGNEKPLSKKNVFVNDRIQAIYTGERYIALVFNDVSGEGMYIIDIYRSDGEKVDSIRLNRRLKDIMFSKDRVMIYDELHLLVHTLGGEDNFDGTFETPFVTLVPAGSSFRYAALDREGIKVLELK